MELATSGLRPSTIQRLVQCGFRTSDDLKGCSIRDLANETKLNQKEASSVIQWMNGQPLSTLSVSDLLKIESRGTISTQIQELDDILGGGLATGEVTEVCGVPGIGKTQFAIQASLTAQLSTKHGGLDAEAVFIDTEGSFMIQRVASMASAVSANERERNELLKHIYYFRVHDYQELYEVIEELEGFLKDHGKVKLIVIDSIAFHFRHEFEDMAVRSRCLLSLSVQLHQIATKHHLAVLLINQVTTKINSNAVSNLIPALGDSWSHCVTSRILLSWKGPERVAELTKSPYRRNQTALFQVSSKGVRGMREHKRKWG